MISRTTTRFREAYRRIVVVKARNGHEAVRRAKQYGRRQQTSYKNADSQTFRARFLGLVDVMDLQTTPAEEVYYALSRISRPERYLKADRDLSVFRQGPKTFRSAWWAVPFELASPARSGRSRGRRGV